MIKTELTNDFIIENNIFSNPDMEYENYIATWFMEYGLKTGNYIWGKSTKDVIDILNDSFVEVILDKKTYFREKKLRYLIN